MGEPLTVMERQEIAAALLGNPQNWHHLQDDIIPRLLDTVAAAEQAQDALRLRAENAEQDRDTLRRDLARAGQAVAAAEQRATRLGALETAARNVADLWHVQGDPRHWTVAIETLRSVVAALDGGAGEAG